MNPAPLRAVVDASVAIKIFVPETLSVEAQELFGRFATDGRLSLSAVKRSLGAKGGGGDQRARPYDGPNGLRHFFHPPPSWGNSLR